MYILDTQFTSLLHLDPLDARVAPIRPRLQLGLPLRSRRLSRRHTALLHATVHTVRLEPSIPWNLH